MKESLFNLKANAAGFGILAVLCVASVPVIIGEKIEKKIASMLN